MSVYQNASDVFCRRSLQNAWTRSDTVTDPEHQIGVLWVFLEHPVFYIERLAVILLNVNRVRRLGCHVAVLNQCLSYVFILL